jgi:hypothetical protein
MIIIEFLSRSQRTQINRHKVSNKLQENYKYFYSLIFDDGCDS